jgi:4-amino-4-deoxy-L-arabinose transferase-like glycosyltransferase
MVSTTIGGDASTESEGASLRTSGVAPLRAQIGDKRLLYLSLFLMGFALRYGVVLWKHTYLMIHGPMLPFGTEVCSIAESIAEGRGFSSPFRINSGPTAWIAPIYPYLMALWFRLFGLWSPASAFVMLSLQCLMAAATGIAIYALGARTLGTRVGLWAAWLWEVCPVFFAWPVLWIWDFAATALLVAVALVCTLDAAEKATTKTWLRLGAIWALTALTNPAPLSVMPVSVAYAAYVNYKQGAKWVRSVACFAVFFLAIISPWLVRNYAAFHRPIFLRSNYWFEFHLGNYHASNGLGYSGKHPLSNPAAMQQYLNWGEPQFVEYYKKDAFDFVRKFPGEFMDLTLHRAWWFWDGTWVESAFPPGWWASWMFWPLSLLGWIGFLFLLSRRPRGWILFAALLLIYPIPYYIAYPNPKYRHAIEPELLLLSVYLVSVLWGEITLRRRTQPAR